MKKGRRQGTARDSSKDQDRPSSRSAIGSKNLIMNQLTPDLKSNHGILAIPKGGYVPYDEVDTNVVSLVRALNAFSGIATISSCGGHHNPAPGQVGPGAWRIMFEAKHSDNGWFALEFVAWVIHDCIRGGRNVTLRADSPPPYLNKPGASLAFVLEGWNNENPDDLAGWMNQMREENYISPPRKAPFSVLAGPVLLAISLVKRGLNRWLKRPGFQPQGALGNQPVSVE